MKVEKGARVRVTYEGVVAAEPGECCYSDRGLTQVQPDGHPDTYAFVPVDSIEVLAPPPRKFEDGAYYLHPFGAVQRYSRATDDFRLTHDSTIRVRRMLVSPNILASYVKLVPEEQA